MCCSTFDCRIWQTIRWIMVEVIAKFGYVWISKHDKMYLWNTMPLVATKSEKSLLSRKVTAKATRSLWGSSIFTAWHIYDPRQHSSNLYVELFDLIRLNIIISTLKQVLLPLLSPSSLIWIWGGGGGSIYYVLNLEIPFMHTMKFTSTSLYLIFSLYDCKNICLYTTDINLFEVRYISHSRGFPNPSNTITVNIVIFTGGKFCVCVIKMLWLVAVIAIKTIYAFIPLSWGLKNKCMFPLTRPTLFYATDPKLFSASKIHFIPVDKSWFALSHLYQVWLIRNKHKGK